MTVRKFRSTDANAPVLTAQCGKLVQVLDAILVNGYTGTASLGWSIAYTGYAYSGTATGGANNKLIDTTRNFTTDGVVVGASVHRTADGLNAGVTSITTTTNPNDTLNFTATTNTPTFGAADAYTIDGNLRVYRAPSGNRYYLRVSDLLPQSALIRGWEVKADVLDVADASNTGPFPTHAQSSTVSCWKGDLNALPKVWNLFSNGVIFYMIINAYPYYGWAGYATGMMFGDYVSYKAGDTWNTILCGNSTAAYNTCYIYYASAGLAGGCYQVRLNSGVGASVLFARRPIMGEIWVGVHWNVGTYPNPDPITGGLILSRIMVLTGGLACGYLPGIWSWLHPLGYHGDTISGATGGTHVNRTFEYWASCSGGAQAGCWIETSDTW